MSTIDLNPLISIPPAALALIAGDARRRLVSYLNRWDHGEVLLRYLDAWLALQPNAVSLREGRARVLAEQSRGDDALALLDALDGERAPTATRRRLRMQALIAAGRFAELDPLLDAMAEDDEQAPYAWLLRGDLERARGRIDEAAEAYMEAGARDPRSLAAVRRLAELALDQGDPEAARGQIDALMLRPDFSPTVADLQILLRAAERTGDSVAAATLRDQLHAREHAEREELTLALGLINAHIAEPAPLVEVADPAGAAIDAARRMLREEFGLDDFRPNQARVIQHVLAGVSSLAVMPTGAGKSLTYQLPALLLPRATVVISPLIALMKDQIDNMPDGVRARSTLINSSLSPSELASRVRRLASGEYKLVYVAPERLRQRAFLHALARCGVSLLVVDEAHCVSMWGQSFRPDYLFIGRAIAELGNPPLLALTATASADTQTEIRHSLGRLEPVVASVFRPNLYFQVLRAGNRNEKLQALSEVCRRIDGPMIVYARARQACEELADALRRQGIAAEHYHAQVADRSAVQERFMRGEIRVLVATVAFGMGIDKSDIRGIVHYNLPQSVEAYYQEAGRAGRDGLPAYCVLLYAPSDRARLSSWLNEESITRDQLRDLFRAIRRLMRGTYDVVDLDQLQRGLPGDDDTLVRVGLNMLERVGLIRRHFDIPEIATITGLDASPPDPLAARMIELTGLTPGIAVDVDLLLLAEHLELPPADLEAAMLAWHDAGLLRYRGGTRQALLELLTPPDDVAARIDALLADYKARQEQRIESMAAYARGAGCRHSALAAHFGQRLARCKSACDICSPGHAVLSGVVRTGSAPQPLPPRDERDSRPDVVRLLDGLAELPFPLGRTGLARALKGSADSAVDGDRFIGYGNLRHLAQKTIEEMIEQLIDGGYIQRDEYDEYRRLSLTLLGVKARRDAAYLPEWA